LEELMTTPATSPAETKLYMLANAIRQLQQGRSNATGSFTITPNATTTTVTAPCATSSSYIALFPQTADAANDMATTYAIAANGQFTVHHAANARSDRTFGFEVRG
jgi:hypothetical protein